MKKFFSSSAFVYSAVCAALMSVSFLNSNAQVVQSAPQDAQDLKAAAQNPDAPPVPPELTALVNNFVSAFLKGDDAALDACWHTPSALASAPDTVENADAAQNRQQQVQRNVNDAAETKVSSTQLRTFIGQHFGAPEQVKFLRLELSRGAAATTASENTYDDVKLHFLVAGRTHIMLSIDDVVKINGVWKFRGRLKDELTVMLPKAM